MGEFTAPVCTVAGCVGMGEPLHPVTGYTWVCLHCEQLYEVPEYFDTFTTEEEEDT